MNIHRIIKFIAPAAEAQARFLCPGRSRTGAAVRAGSMANAKRLPAVCAAAGKNAPQLKPRALYL
ncbi:hypothetical protein [Bacillus subtilis]|uniref:hypothetical protein n=1 Tax=Bacillus subtilis TaxID=1423 RepID=UPI001363FF02|nr:hypothetical protein [Bacillus subtilis]